MARNTNKPQPPNRTDTIAALTIARKAHRANRTALIECPKGGVERASILRRRPQRTEGHAVAIHTYRQLAGGTQRGRPRPLTFPAFLQLQEHRALPLQHRQRGAHDRR